VQCVAKGSAGKDEVCVGVQCVGRVWADSKKLKITDLHILIFQN
jgi:hypothetical protein